MNTFDSKLLILDGGFGTMVQSYRLCEADYRGERFADWHLPLAGCNDVLVLTRSDVVSEIHRKYLMVGADIITTDTFNANAVSLADYGLQHFSREIACCAARLARTEADEFTRRNPSKRRFVAGSVGPTSRSLSISPDVGDAAKRAITFVELKDAYRDQICGLIEGGVDFVQLETFFDALNAKAAIFAADEAFELTKRRVGIVVSGTMADGGRTLAGQTVEAFYTSVEHCHPLAVGLNCGFGARQMLPFVRELSAVSRYPVAAYPNAGLPNLEGEYDQSAEMMADDVRQYLREGVVNIIGGCCGTTPAHILEIADIARHYRGRTLQPATPHLTLSGLERLEITPESNFINIGERTNVAGSAKFARLVREGNFESALSVARDQIEAGARIIDICFDDAMIDARSTMIRFLNLAAGEPDVARVPFMIDSSSWEVLEAGLQCVQGKCVVNSLSLKEGEEEFRRRATLVGRYGAAVVVMLFDERGQADTFDRKIEVAERAYRILTDIGFEQQDIVFDPNVLAVATGIESHDGYAKAFIDACRWIRQQYPLAGISGGVSNLSFSFRGINTMRSAMHSVFLYHAIAAGMNMGIVNPAMTVLYDDIDPALREAVEDVILCRRADAAERLTALAQQIKSTETGTEVQVQHEQQWRSESVGERVAYALLHGVTDFVAADALEAYRSTGSAVEVIDKFFMPAMERVGELFGSGKMFLPQVVKSARVMKAGVAALMPYVGESEGLSATGARKVLIATVKGDVHDIGKNIVSVVMSCNGYLIKDLGVMVDAVRIATEAAEWGADAVGLSGLINPSLEQMIAVVDLLNARVLTIPVIIGGATTSALHTAVKIAPHYGGVVVHCRNASDNVYYLSRLFSDRRSECEREIRAAQQRLRDDFASSHKAATLTVEQAAAHVDTKSPSEIVVPAVTGIESVDRFSLAELVPLIDWTFFFNAWELRGHYPELLDDSQKGEQARKLFADARSMLDAIVDRGLLSLTGRFAIVPAHREGESIVAEWEGRRYVMPVPRGLTERSGYRSLVDYVATSDDYVGMFAVSAAVGLKELAAKLRSGGDDYGAIMAKLLTDRLTEALAEVMHRYVRRTMWGYEKGDELSVRRILDCHYQGRRMAFGYPACPDHSLKRQVFDLLDIEHTTPLRLKESMMIDPGETLCGLIFADRTIDYFSVLE